MQQSQTLLRAPATAALLGALILSGCAGRAARSSGLAKGFHTTPPHSGSAQGSAHRKIAPGDWSRVDALPLRSSVIMVRLKSGDLVKGAVQSANAETLTLVDSAGRETPVLRNDVKKVELRKDREETLNGTAIGLATGAGAGSAFAVAISIAADVTTAVTVPFLAGIGGGLGALVGYLIDKSLADKETLYLAP